MRAADDPFAWSLSLLHISSAHIDAALSAQSRLLRHAPAFFRPTRPHSVKAPLSDAERVPTLPLLLHGLDVEELRGLFGEPRLRLLRHPALRQLRSLKLWTRDSRGDVDEATFAVIAALPRLSSLQLTTSTPGDEWWSGLASMPALTSLSICELTLDETTLLPHVACCAHLRHLQIIGCRSPALDGHRFGALFSGLHMSRLRSLVLHDFHVGERRKFLRQSVVLPSDADFAAAFGAMQDLHSLHLLHGSGHDLLLSHLPRARSLCELRMMPEEVDDISSDCMPSAAMLVVVLDALPALQCELDMRQQCQCEDDGQILDYSPIAISLQRFGDRFKMSHIPAGWENEEDD